MSNGPLEPNLKQALDLAMALMSIPGKSGEEDQVQAFVVEKLKKAGVPKSAFSLDQANKKSPLGGAVGNLIVKLPGAIKAPRRMLSAHLDTVPICIGSKPVVRGDRVASADSNTGLGADDRAGVAAILTAAIEIFKRRLPHPPLTFLFTVQEEVGLFGARYVNSKLLGRPSLAFNFDGGSASKVTIGATGAFRMDVEIEGLASHAGVHPEEGISAIAIAGLAIARLQKNGWHGLVKKGDHSGTSNIGVIRSGDATNVVAPLAMLRCEARSHDPKFRKKILKKYRRAFEQAVEKVSAVQGVRGKLRFEHRLDYESFVLDSEAPCVLAAQSAIQSIGEKPALVISDGGLDANWLHAHHVPAVTLGAGQEKIHTSNETLNIDEFQKACRIALRLATATEGA